MRSFKGMIWTALALAGTVNAGEARPAASIADLAWMTGAWQGPAGEDAILQETWLEPSDDAMAAVVRMLEGGRTDMMELIIIEEAEGSLVFRIQQWSKGFEPRMAGPQKLVLAQLGENRVRFVAEDANSVFRSLTYSRPSEASFNIQLTLANPPMSYEFKLSPR